MWLVSFTRVFALLILTIGLAACSTSIRRQPLPKEINMAKITPLPNPRTNGSYSLEETLERRRSVRSFTDEPITQEETSQLLWAAQGITNRHGFRTAPSAGALYPLELYIVTPEGIFHYDPADHALIELFMGDLRNDLSQAALNQEAVLKAPLTLVITAVYQRTEGKYGALRGPRYVHMEVGHAAQNVLLQAVSLDLGAVPIGAFNDDQVQTVLGLPADHEPVYLIPIGHPQ